MPGLSEILVLVGLILLVTLGVLAAVLIPLFRWIRRKSERLASELSAELASRGESLLRGPESAVYRGASAGLSKIKGNGALAVTKTRLVFVAIAGPRVELPLSELTGVRLDPWFLRSNRGGKPHLILQRQDGSEIGFFVQDTQAWSEALLREIEMPTRDGYGTSP